MIGNPISLDLDTGKAKFENGFAKTNSFAIIFQRKKTHTKTNTKDKKL